MTGDAFRMDVTLTVDGVHAEIRCPGELEPDSADGGAPETSTLPTIRVLQAWLGRWGVFSTLAVREEALAGEFGGRANFAGLPVPDTVKVLGEHLYGLAFPPRVSGLFGRAREAAIRAGTDLRIVLHIQDTPGEADGDWPGALPWEFLHHPDGYFLATEAQLVLSRFLERREARVEMPRTALPLRILYVAAIPDRQQLWAEREAASNLGLRLQWDETRAVVKGEIGWTLNADDSPLDNRDVVHIAGVARPVDKDRMEMDLPGVAPGQSEEQLVTALTRPSPANPRRRPPRLVVLHLLESNPFDYTATFGGHARALVRAGVPAVLAMQYPMPIEQIQRFTETFYQKLTQLSPTMSIDQAVHAARLEVDKHAGWQQRLFAAPVLYLQSTDGYMVGADEPPAEQAPSPGPSSPGTVLRGPIRPHSETSVLLEELDKVVRWTLPDDGSAARLRLWLRSVPWARLSPAEAEREIRGRMRADTGPHGPAYEGMLRCLKELGDRDGT